MISLVSPSQDILSLIQVKDSDLQISSYINQNFSLDELSEIILRLDQIPYRIRFSVLLVDDLPTISWIIDWENRVTVSLTKIARTTFELRIRETADRFVLKYNQVIVKINGVLRRYD